MGVSNGGDGGPLRWAHKVVRLTEEAMQLVAPAVSPRAFKGGLGEPPTPRGLVDEPILDKEHRFWLVIKHVSSTDKCTLLPLIATGRFGGCGRRAGRVRWKPAPLKQGYEREAMADTLLLVAAESITSARDQDDNAWVIDDQDAEHAAREQAAAARNKKRRQVYEEAQANGQLPKVCLLYTSPSPRDS